MKKLLIIPHLKNIDECLQLAKEHDLGFEFNDFYHPEMLDNFDKLTRTAKKYKTHGLPDYCTSHGDFFDVLPFSEDKYVREIAEMRVRQSINAARLLNVKAVIFHTNYNPFFTGMESYSNFWAEKNISFWSKFLESNPDINIYIENMCDFTPDLLVRLADELCPKYRNFGICFDYAHAMIYGNDINNWVKSVAPYTKHMHINDNDLKNDLHLAVGDGQINWEIFKAHLSEFPDISVLIETADIENQRRSIDFLNRLGIL